jgi:hypothetical protein
VRVLPGGAQPRCGLLRRRSIDIGDLHVRPLGVQDRGDAQPDAPRSSRDDRDLPVEPFHVLRLLRGR